MSLNNIIYNCEKFNAKLDYMWKKRLLEHEMETLKRRKNDQSK